MATIKKAQKGKKVSPTYKNLRMGVRNEQYQMTGQNKDVTPSSKDSARYRGGFEQGLKGMKGMPGEGNVEKMGRWEGQNTKKKGKMGVKVKKAQVGRLVKKAIGTVGKDVEKKASNKTLATWRDASGKVYKRETEKSLERDALKKYKAETAPKNKMEAKIDKRERKIARDNDAYDKAVWESYQKNGGKTRKSMKMGGAVKKAQNGVKDPELARMRNTYRPATSVNPKAPLPPSAQALRTKRMIGKNGNKISKSSKKK